MPPVPLRRLWGKRASGYVSWHRKRKARHTSAVLDALVRDVRARYADAVCVTGDLTNLALPGEAAPSAAWLRALGEPVDVHAIPGNHDAYARGAAAPETVWPAWMAGDGQAPGFPYVRERAGVAIIGVSSAVATPLFMASGRVGAAQLTALREALTATGARGLTRVVMVHHPPQAGAAGWRHGLTDAAAMRAVLAEAGAELVLHGHLHQPVHTHVPGRTGPIPVVGVPSASSRGGGRDAPAGYALIELGAGGGRLHRRTLTDSPAFGAAGTTALV